MDLGEVLYPSEFVTTLRCNLTILILKPPEQLQEENSVYPTPSAQAHGLEHAVFVFSSQGFCVALAVLETDL